MKLVEDVGFDGAFSFAVQPAAGNAGGGASRPGAARRRAGTPGAPAGAARHAIPRPATRWSARASGCSSPAARRKDARELAARTENNRVVNLGGDPALIGTYVDVTHHRGARRTRCAASSSRALTHARPPNQRAPPTYQCRCCPTPNEVPDDPHRAFARFSEPPPSHGRRSRSRCPAARPRLPRRPARPRRRAPAATGDDRRAVAPPPRAVTTAARDPAAAGHAAAAWPRRPAPPTTPRRRLPASRGRSPR